MYRRLTDAELLSVEQWAACDLRDDEGNEVQSLVDEVRAARLQLDEMTSGVRTLLEENDRLTKAINEMPEWERAVKAASAIELVSARGALAEACGLLDDLDGFGHANRLRIKGGIETE